MLASMVSRTAVPLRSETLGLIALLEGVAPGVHRREDDAVFAGEQVVILQFEARDARVVHIGEPQHRGQKLPLWYQRLES